MKKNSISQSSVFNPRALVAFGLCSVAALLAMFSFATPSSEGPYSRPGQTLKMRAESAPLSRAPVAVSADSRYVVFLGDFGFGCCVVSLYDRQTEITTSEASANFGGAISISADGRVFAYNLYPEVYVRDRQGGFETISVAPDGSPAACNWVGCVKSSWDASLSADGRFIAFYSFASNLVTGDNNQTADVFVRDRQTATTERVSLATDGTQGNNISVEPSISADARYVAFRSFATNLVSGNINTATCAGSGQSSPSDVYVHDRQTGTTELVSVGMAGTQDGCSWAPSISADGRYVAFTSAASTLIPSDTNGGWDVFVRDRQTGRTERVSVDPYGAQGICSPSSCRCGASSISPDGRYVVFHSFQSLVPDDTNQTGDIFVHDRETGSTERVSLAYPGGEVPGMPPGNANNTSGPDADQPPAISADGRIVVFDSFASDLVEGDGSGIDAFVRDRGNAVGIGALNAACSANPVTASGWATFSGGAIASANDPANDGVPPAAAIGAELIGASIAYRPEHADLFVSLPVTSLTANVGGAPGVLYGLKITVGAIPYEVRATQAEGFALYNCQQPPTCSQVATLAGSMGTTGNEVTVSVPLSALGAGEGVALSGLSAYTALGTAAAGPGAMLDDVALPPTSIPVHSVSLGVAPVGTPEAIVIFNTPATLANGNFSGTLPPLSAGSYNVWARACLGSTCGKAASTLLTVTQACAAPPVQLNSVVSRKVHGSAGTFDVDLPLTGNPGIECRSGGPNGLYTLIFTFANSLRNVEQASFNGGQGTDILGEIDPSDAHNYIVGLSGITTPQVITVFLNNVTDSAGNFSPTVRASMAVLVGDTTANGSVNSSDISQTKAQSGTVADSSNFRTDVTVNGLINSSDISTVKSNSGTALP